MVYIREAHAIDSEEPMTGDGEPVVEDPFTLAERRDVARQCRGALQLSAIPGVIDGIDDAVNTAYHAWPDRLYLIGSDGVVAFQGGMGPFGFEPDELEKAILRVLEAE